MEFTNFFEFVLQEIKRHDQGIYRCRVDFKKSQTSSFKFNLTVISEFLYNFFIWNCIQIFQKISVPPEDPIVLDGWGRALNSTTIGPKEEGDDVTLTCRVIGGMFYKFKFFVINYVS